MKEGKNEFELVEESISRVRTWQHDFLFERYRDATHQDPDCSGLAAAFLLSNCKFHSGTLNEPVRSVLLERAVLPLIIFCAGLSPRLASAIASRILKVARPGTLLRDLVREVVHLRYTNFLVGFFFVLSASERLRKLGPPEWVSYYQGLSGHFLCLMGRFDLGIPQLERSVSELSSASGLPMTRDFFIDELSAILAMQLMYAGKLSRAEEAFGTLMETFGRRPYVWLEVFSRSMRITLASETLDQPSLAKDTQALQRILGPGFRSKYGLRTLICSGLIAAMRKDLARANAMTQRAMELYSDQISKVELTRYHLICALIDLEFGDASGAFAHSRHSRRLSQQIEGATFHSSEALLFESEIILRSGLLKPGSVDRSSIRGVVSRLKRAKRKLKGSSVLAARIETLSRLGSWLLSEESGGAVGFPVGEQACQGLSPRFVAVLRGLGHSNPASTAVAMSSREIVREAVSAEFVRSLALVMRDEVDFQAVATALCSAALADSVEYLGSNSGADRGGASDFNVEWIADDVSRLELHLGKRVHAFSMKNPLVSLESNPLAREQIRLVLTILEAFENRANIIALEKDSAIASMTQMLAHDVRKPFSMLKSVIQIVEKTEDPREAQEVLESALPEVIQAIASVEGMIHDVMHIGSESNWQMEDAAPETLIEAALGDLFRVFPEADVSISYSLSHRHGVRIDPLRIGRVFANILENAVQAMSGRGTLWIKTAESNGSIEFTLGNAGSFIPGECVSKIFEAFFTSGKRGGTGLGLAIARKIVEGHGGTIRCLSERNETHTDGMVEFVFTLPAAEVLCGPRSNVLPRTSREVRAALAAARVASAWQVGARHDPSEARMENEILSRLAAMRVTDSPLATVLVVEDEAVYRKGLLTLLAQPVSLSSQVHVVFAKNEPEAMAAVRDRVPDLIIADHDLGPGSKDGLEIVRTLRQQGFTGPVCVHSNRFLARDHGAALAAGADTVFPKPMSRAHLLKLLLIALREVQSETPTRLPRPRKWNVVMLDDSRTMRMAWKMELQDEAHFRSFESPSGFFEACREDESYLAELDVVLTDKNFGPGERYDGSDFARELRERGFGGVILLASGESGLGARIDASFDGDVGKEVLPWPAFEAAVLEAERRKGTRKLSDREGVASM